MRIGIIGYGTRTGLGSQHADLWSLGLADAWLAPAHPQLGHDETVLPPLAVRCALRNDFRKYTQFLESIQALIFIERPVLDQFDTVGEARRRGVFTCCIPNMEWLPDPRQAAWLRQVQMLWAPTQAAFRELRALAAANPVPCAWYNHVCGGTWGVNLSRFRFQLRERCRKFLFCSGHGGVNLRKGADLIAQAAALAPECSLVVYSQRHNLPAMPPNCEVRIQNLATAAELYAGEGDILLSPSRWEGVGLPLYEGQACGLPVITTNAPPMNECGALALINASTGSITLRGKRVPSYTADPAHLAALMREWRGRDLVDASQAARHNMEQNFSLARTFTELRAALESHMP